MIKQLLEPILDDGIQHINFFNGRLLSGEDLNGERNANREARLRLGQALGEGVAFGLEVKDATGRAPTTTDSRRLELPIEVQPGLAINRRGETLALKKTVYIPLADLPGGSGSASGTGFEPCRPPEGGTYIAGAGVYVLTIGSVVRGEGRAPVSGLGNSPAGCNVQFNTEGVRFNLMQVNLTTQERSGEALLRNRLAYRCFGLFDDQLRPARNPFDIPTTYGLLDELRRSCLTEDQVPLALIYLTAGGIRFMDMWAVRRRPTRPASPDPWAWFGGERRQSEAEAMFYQFQAHLRDIWERETGVANLVARDRFAFLPPVGLLPINGTSLVTRFNPSRFFQGLTVRDAVTEPVFIEGARLPALLRAGLAYPPINLSSGELIWLYHVRENSQALDTAPLNRPQAYLVFATGHIPFLGDARYDVNRWFYSNFA